MVKLIILELISKARSYIMKRLYTILYLLVFTLSAKSQSAYIPPEKPRLVISIIVEQLRYDQLERIWDILPDNGMKRMINEGTYYRNASIDYLSTQAAPGFATISTGASPSAHGITSDSWFHPFNNEMIYCVQDANASPVGGSFETGLFSPVNLLSSTFADELQMSSCGGSKVYGIGIREMSAIITAGHAADGAFWYDDRTGTWMSSTYYTRNLPRGSWISMPCSCPGSISTRNGSRFLTRQHTRDASLTHALLKGASTARPGSPMTLSQCQPKGD
jgi:hypothetical protein